MIESTHEVIPMKKHPLIIAVLLFTTMLLFVAGCKKEPPVKPEPAHLDLSPQGRMLVAASNDFAFNIFKETEKTTGMEENMMLSPLSISLALGMTMNGAANTTLDSIKNTIGFDQLTQHEINHNFKVLMPFLVQADPLTTLSIANSIWYRNGFQPLPTFIDTCTHYYSAMVSQLNFSDLHPFSPSTTGLPTRPTKRSPNCLANCNPML